MIKIPRLFLFIIPKNKNNIVEYIFDMASFFIVIFFKNYSQTLVYNSNLNENPQINRMNTNQNFKICNSTSEPFNVFLQNLDEEENQIKLDLENGTQLHIRKGKNEDKYYVTVNNNNKKTEKKNYFLEYKIPFTLIFKGLRNDFNFHFIFKQKLMYEIPYKSENDDQIKKHSIILDIEHLNTNDFEEGFKNFKVYFDENYNFKGDKNFNKFIFSTENIEFNEEMFYVYITMNYPIEKIEQFLLHFYNRKQQKKSGKGTLKKTQFTLKSPFKSKAKTSTQKKLKKNIKLIRN